MRSKTCRGDAATPCLEGLESLVEKALVQVAAGGASLHDAPDDRGVRRSGSTTLASVTTSRCATPTTSPRSHARCAWARAGPAGRGARASAWPRSRPPIRTGHAARRRARGRPASGRRGAADLRGPPLLWHIRGKNITAGRSSTAFLAAGSDDPPTGARAGAMRTAALGAWRWGSSRPPMRSGRGP